MFFSQYEFFSIPIKYSNARRTFNVNMRWLMLLTVKEKRKTIESKYFGHISFSFLAKIGIIFDTIIQKLNHLI